MDCERSTLPGIGDHWCGPASNSLAETAMLPTLPAEILDLIVDHLHDKPITLKSCCLVSKSWVPRARRTLFAQVEFSSIRYPIRSWMKAFPDPRNSPAHHTRDLHFLDHRSITAASAVAPAWVRRFCHIKRLQITAMVPDTSIPVPLVHLHGLSPTLKFLRIGLLPAPFSSIFNLICSFPLLEDLSLHFVTTLGDADGWDIPSTSPGLTGSLYLASRTHSVIRGLLDLPNGLHFTKVTTSCLVEDAKWVVDLISRCSDTLEYLDITYYSPTPPYSPTPGRLDLSKATKLKEMKFKCIRLEVQWIAMAVRTAKSTDLRTIMIVVTSRGLPAEPVGETIHREWQDLDHLLDQLWTSRLVCPTITFEGNGDHVDLRRLVEILLPKLARKGAVD